jgi:hypothetical protein
MVKLFGRQSQQLQLTQHLRINKNGVVIIDNVTRVNTAEIKDVNRATYLIVQLMEMNASYRNAFVHGLVMIFPAVYLPMKFLKWSYSVMTAPLLTGLVAKNQYILICEV